MDRRAFLATSALASFDGFLLSSATVSQAFADGKQSNHQWKCPAASVGAIRLHAQTRRHR